MKYHSSKLFRVWIKTIRYLSSDSCVREETQYLRKVCEGKVEQGARGLEFGSSLTQETFSQLVKEWEALVNSVQEYQELLKANDIGVESNERQRIQQTARRVGLEVPPVWFEEDTVQRN